MEAQSHPIHLFIRFIFICSYLCTRDLTTKVTFTKNKYSALYLPAKYKLGIFHQFHPTSIVPTMIFFSYLHYLLKMPQAFTFQSYLVLCTSTAI